MNTHQKSVSVLLNSSSVDITMTLFDWNDLDNVRRWSMVHPDVSQLTPAQCRSILLYRDELPEKDDQLFLPDDAEYWQYRVDQSDREHSDIFVPLVGFYYDIPELGSRPSSPVMQHMLRDFPLVVVLVDGKPKLCVSENRLDLPQYFCLAYMLLGLLPPLAMVDIPEYSHYVEPTLLSACERTIEIMENRCRVKRNILNKVKKKSLSHPSIA